MVFEQDHRMARVISPDEWFLWARHPGRPESPEDPRFSELRVPGRAREEAARGSCQALREETTRYDPYTGSRE